MRKSMPFMHSRASLRSAPASDGECCGLVHPEVFSSEAEAETEVRCAALAPLLKCCVASVCSACIRNRIHTANR